MSMKFLQLLEQFYNRAEDVDGVKTIYISKKQALYLARLAKNEEIGTRTTVHEMKADFRDMHTKFTPSGYRWKLEFLKYTE